MQNAIAQAERTEFSARLIEALRAAGHDPRAQLVTREFNVRSGGSPVTAYAVRRWLNGGSFPTQPKICVLARWLGVTQVWLRYGSGAQCSPGQIEMRAISRDVEMIVNDYRHLDAHSKQIFDTTLSTMLALQK